MIRKGGNSSREGFTIAELIIVIVIIAVLVAISVITYKTVTDNAELQTARTDVQNVAAKLVRYKSSNGSFPSQSDFSSLNLTQNTQSTMTYTYNAGADTFCILATNQNQTAYATDQNTQGTQGQCP